MNTNLTLNTLIAFPTTLNLINTFKWSSLHLQTWVNLSISPISKLLRSFLKINSSFAINLDVARSKKQLRLFSRKYFNSKIFSLNSKVRRVSRPLGNFVNCARVANQRYAPKNSLHPSRSWQPLVMVNTKAFPLKRVWRRNINRQLLEVDGYQSAEIKLKPLKTNTSLAKLASRRENLNSSYLSNFLKYLAEVISKNNNLSDKAQIVAPISLSYKIRRKSKRRYKDNSYAFLGIKNHKLNFKHRVYPKFSKKIFNKNAVRFRNFISIFNQLKFRHESPGVANHPLKLIQPLKKKIKLPTQKIRHVLQRAVSLWDRQFSRIPRRKARKKPKWIWKILKHQCKFFPINKKKSRQFSTAQKVHSSMSTFTLKLKVNENQPPLFSRLWLTDTLILSSNSQTSRGIKIFQNHLLRPGTLNSFSKSPFFFLELLNSSLTNAPQLCQPNRVLVKPSRYVVFQTANSIKINIFRRLMGQKLSSDLKIKAMKSSIRSRTTKSKKTFSSIFYTKFNLINRKHNLYSFFQPHSIADVGNPWLSFNSKTVRSVSTSIAPRIKRIRFKPGYSRIWRKGRATVQEILGVSYRYQYRLTPKLQKLFMQTRNSSLHLSPLTLEFSLLSTRLITDCWVVRDLISTGTVFLNGVTCLKSETRLFQGDLVQLIVHLKFYTVFKWLANVSFKKQRRLNKVFYRRIKAPTPNRPYRMEKKLPDWFFNLNSTYGDIPSCFEVDYFTLSTFVVHSGRDHSRKLPWKSTNFNYSILNMYNWKYIT